MSKSKGGNPNRPLTYREELAAQRLVATGVKRRAFEEAGYKVQKTEKKTGNEVTKVFSRPAVKRRVEELLAERYPDHEGDFAALLRRQMQLALEQSELTPESLKVTEQYARILGHHAPTKSVSAKIPSRALSLPGEVEASEPAEQVEVTVVDDE